MAGDPREDRLPAWAREQLRDLRYRLAHATEPLVRQLSKALEERKLFKARNEAMTELLECAARGGHKTAEEIMKIIAPYCDDEYVTLDAVLSAGRHEDESGVDLGRGY